MRKTLGILLAAILVLSLTVFASMIVPAADIAREKSPAIGENGDLQRVDFIHYAKSSSPGKPQKTETCYKLMGVKWGSLPVNYVINPTNPEGLSADFVKAEISTAAETWDSSTSKELFNNSYIVDLSAKYGVQNFRNAVVFGDYPNDGVIAVTSIWYSRRTGQILEFDMLFNTRFDWGDATVNNALMDLENIATHELGHSIGLNDIYTSSCASVTMYGYSTEGDIAKRSLETADITGLQKMYG
jgi:hypothetical protein